MHLLHYSRLRFFSFVLFRRTWDGCYFVVVLIVVVSYFRLLRFFLWLFTSFKHQSHEYLIGLCQLSVYRNSNIDKEIQFQLVNYWLSMQHMFQYIITSFYRRLKKAFLLRLCCFNVCTFFWSFILRHSFWRVMRI